MKHLKAFEDAINTIRDEGRYRVFIDLQRHRGQFPRATARFEHGEEKDIVVWCSNDYLGMGQDDDVINAMHEAVDTFGAGSGGTRNISGTTRFHVDLERENIPERKDQKNRSWKKKQMKKNSPKKKREQKKP